MSKRVLRIFLLTIVAQLCVVVALRAQGQNKSVQELDYNAPVQTVTIADIKVTGADNYEDYVLIGFSGLSVGQEIKLPGNDITSSIQRFWKQGYFSEVSFLMDTLRNDSIWLTIALKQLPRISQVNFYGLKKSEIEDVEKAIDAAKGRQLTPDMIDRTKIAIRKYLSDKGFGNAEILVYQKDDSTLPGNVIVDISIDKKEKVKVNDLIIHGNNALTVNQIDKAMKKTNRASNLWNLFRSKKFIKGEYENDKSSLISKYNEIGYRDAEIVRDSVVKLDNGQVNVILDVEEGKKYYFGDIKWLGNTMYPNDYLDALLNVKKGDVYNLKQLNKRLFEDEDGVSSLYKDNGYLFMNIDPVEVTFNGDSIDFEMRIYEGKPATINRVNITGNDRLYEHVIRRELRTKPGNLYSQADLVRTLREIAQMKQFDEEKLYTGVDIQPNYEDGTVDITYNLETKSSDQVEFSAGWGQQGLVLSLGLKFSNFAIQNIFKPKMYRIVPQGEGQTFSIRAQTNGVYYQNYSVSFFDPWIGGKRPNSFSLSIYYSIQTGMSQRYLNSYQDAYNYYNYNNMYNNGIYGNNGYNNGYYDSYGNTEYDKNVYLRTFGVAAGFGTRLSWPDDYFSLYTELSYQRYDLKDWYSYYFGFSNGISNNLSLSLTLSRNSINNPIYTRRGSSFSVTVAATPPYSVFTDIDYATVSEAERVKWIEYYKIKLNGKMFVPITRDEKLVLMARAEYGFLGYYNINKRSPFERYYVGGDGMSGYTTAGTEIVGLRGYEAGSLTPMNSSGYNGNLYTKLTMELRYPLLLQQSTTIWALAFVEAGNCWADFQNFNPFELKRSAGVGVRVFLPMFGLLGVDWGYGFDHANNGARAKGGSQFAFVLGQEF